MTSRDEELRKLWADPHAGRSYICERLRMTRPQLEARRIELGLGAKPRVPGRCVYEPTPEEIEQRKLEASVEWTDRVRESRGFRGNGAVFLKDFSFCRRTFSFS